MKPSADSFPIDDDKYEKLPKYARNHIEALRRDVTRLNEKVDRMVDKAVSTKAWVDDYAEDIGRDREYIQGDRITINHEGVWLRVSFYEDKSIRLSWSGGRFEHSMDEVALIPESYQQARLVSKENLR